MLVTSGGQGAFELEGMPKQAALPLELSTCRDCGAAVVYVRTPKGRLNPLNLEPDPVKGNIIVQQVEGETPVAVVVKLNDPRGPKYTSHFMNCPEAERRRRR